ncbi:MAG TPA: alcohol dehydrogenase catalytic domain-containing protein [Candidatus Dormibacteraeota bacterium]|jgi:threonine dehydrogenase-like Zn-dependent dehydrogenase|nr:alcohol dehydrogenase catalytic domain-containing protein [Candidatus Dormibacteraeota bacterium]
MRALECTPTLPGYALARVAGGTRGGPFTMLRLTHRPPPELLGEGWVRLRPRLAGICGSDLSALHGHASPYLGALASSPFVPGHEVVATVAGGGGRWSDGTRVVVEPLLHCGVRGVLPPCPRCAAGEPQGCESVAGDGFAAGLQSGYCAATGGGWAGEMVAHQSQLHEVPGALDDRDAVMVEPLACALHAVLRNPPGADDRVLVVGAGTLGLLIIAALRHAARPRRVIAVAKHDGQRRLAGRLGADVVCTPAVMLRTVRFETGARLVEGRAVAPFLLGGADLTFECSGTAAGLQSAIGCTRAGGTVVMVGMPGRASIDLAPAWHRELSLRGAYGYGIETAGGMAVEPPRRTFAIALEAAQALRPGRLVDDPLPLEDYQRALSRASSAGSRGAVKVAFAPQGEG